MSLYLQPIPRKNGTYKFRLRFCGKDGKRVYVDESTHPVFNSREEAKEFIRVQNAKIKAERHLERHSKGLNAIEYAKVHIDLKENIKGFLEWYQKEAKNSWETSRSWLENYIVPYFSIQHNPNLWCKEFEKFKTHLETATTLNGKVLSPSSQGHIIKTLNSFVKYLGLHGKMDIALSQVKCRGVKRSIMKRRGKDDLISKAEFERLKTVLGPSRDFVVCLMATGCRISELYGLQFTALNEGEEGLDETLIKPYQQMGATIYGWVRLQSQMKRKYAYRDPLTGSIPRKPLKSKPEISEEYNRTIPIIDAEAWDILSANYDRAMDEWEKQTHKSKDTDDYLLFNVDVNGIRRDLKIHTSRTPHCCRHSYTTATVYSFRKVNYGPELIKAITGHTSQEFEKYVHLSMAKEREEKNNSPKRFKNSKKSNAA